MKGTNPAETNTSILLLDDNKELAVCLETILQNFGFDIRTTDNHSRFMEMIHEKKPDVILLDARLQNENGLHICKNLKNCPVNSDIAVIIISGYLHMKEEAAKHGADDFMAKPFGLDELVQKINQQVTLRQDRRRHDFA